MLFRSDDYAEQGISETTTHYEKLIEKIIKDKDASIEELRDSTVFKVLKLLDRLRNKK